MAASILPELGFIGTGLAIGGGFIGLGWKADGGFSPEFRNKLSDQIIRLRRIEPGETWPTIFADLFDHVFGKRHATWKCFRRSSVASIIAFGVMILIWAQLRPEELRKTLIILDFTTVAAITFLFLLVNLIPDYFSLLETRYVIRRMGQTQSGFKILAFLALDVLATTLIFLASMGLIVAVIDTSTFFILKFQGEDLSFWIFVGETLFTVFAELVTHGIVLATRGEAGVSWGVALYTTFFTSVWVWLFALAWGAMRLATRIKPGIRFLIWALPIQDYPIRSIGLAIGALACISYWVFGLAVRIL